MYNWGGRDDPDTSSWVRGQTLQRSLSPQPQFVHTRAHKACWELLNMKKQLWSLVRLALPAVGFALTSSGAYVVSLENQHDYPLMVVPAYVMIVMGFFTMVSGVFWSICHSIKSKVYQRGRLRRQVQVFTIMRSESDHRFTDTFKCKFIHCINS